MDEPLSARTEKHCSLIGPYIKGKKVLEWGCGWGRLIHHFGANPEYMDVRFTGVDISEEAIVRAHLSTQQSEYFCLDGNTFSGTAGSFHTTYSCTCVQHNENESARSILREMARLSSDRVILYENTTRQPDVNKDVVVCFRSIEWYEREMRAFGFDLVHSQVVSDDYPPGEEHSLMVFSMAGSPETP
jgi:ubiquinone/menaquinone biosynthesis C-methylase UbiE